MVSVDEGFRQLIVRHESMGSPIPGFLREPAPSGGSDEPPELAQLYALADGVDDVRWNETYAGRKPEFLPGWEFPSRQDAIQLGNQLINLNASSLQADDDDPSWRPEWQLIFTNRTTGDEHLAMDLRSDFGRLWVVRWQDEVRPLSDGLGDLLAAGAARFGDLQAFWNNDISMFEWDFDREDALGLFP